MGKVLAGLWLTRWHGPCSSGGVQRREDSVTKTSAPRTAVTSLFFSFFLLIAGAWLPAHALTLQAGETVIFDFDFTGQSPPPPYTHSVTFVIDGSGSNIDGTLFGDLGATGNVIVPLPGFGSYTFPVEFSDIVDGVFSMSITAFEGPSDIEIYAFGTTSGDLRTPRLDGVVHTAVVSEPVSLALIGSGLLMAAAFRRRLRR